MVLARVKGSTGAVNVVAVLALALTAVVSLAARKAAVALEIIFAKLQMCKYFVTVSSVSSHGVEALVSIVSSVVLP